jgi:hypothetical protein
MPEVDKEKLPPCGYGSLGLCCSACLLGSCRISPFDRDSDVGPCGDTPDLIVAKNVLKLVIAESLEGLSFLKAASAGLVRENPKDRVTGTRSIKYGLPPRTTPKVLSRYLLKESTNLLSCFPRGEDSFLRNLLPEDAFPILQQDSFSSGSFASLLFDAVKRESNEPQETEKVLRQALQLSVIPLISYEMGQDLHALLHGGGIRRDGQVFEMLDRLPPDPAPVIFLFQDKNVSSKEWLNEMAQEIERALKCKPVKLSLDDIGSLREVGRVLYEKWSLPVAEMKMITLISSPRATSVLGALALGFSAISHPLLPIHGSEKVERFFSEELRKKFGNTYFLSRDALLEFLR